MIRLSYLLSDRWNANSALIDFINADELSLRYKFFLGDQIIVINDVDLSARWGWVPILDFAACLHAMVEKIKQGQSEVIFELTESDAQLQFNRQSDKVLVLVTYSDFKSTVLLSELEYASSLYVKEVWSGVINLYPALKANTSFNNWYPVTI